MLTSPLPRSKEEKDLRKRTKGPLPQQNKHWKNERTPITKYIATLAQQHENQYVIHSAWFTTPEAKEAEYQRRKAAGQTAGDGWVESNVASIEDGHVPDRHVQQGSVTAGRKVLTVDCEMCKSVDGDSVLTRATVLDWDGNVVFDELVKPDVAIGDYLTQCV